MKQAQFHRKVSNLEELKSLQNNECEPYIIEKKIVLFKDEFDDFVEHLLYDQEFIIDNKDLMFHDEKGWHCIEVTTDDIDYSILVECEGYDYARYTSIITKTDKETKTIKWKLEIDAEDNVELEESTLTKIISLIKEGFTNGILEQ